MEEGGWVKRFVLGFFSGFFFSSCVCSSLLSDYISTQGCSICHLGKRQYFPLAKNTTVKLQAYNLDSASSM